MHSLCEMVPVNSHSVQPGTREYQYRTPKTGTVVKDESRGCSDYHSWQALFMVPIREMAGKFKW